MRPSDTPESRISGLNNLLYDAIKAPGIPEARRALLVQMREWTKHVAVPFRERFKERAALEAEIKAIRAFVEVDRRLGYLDPAILQEPFPGSGLYRTGKGSDVPLASETSGKPGASV